ncbi:MAG: hypothetical protein R3F07_07110 [Opitutaceae bacterium]
MVRPSIAMEARILTLDKRTFMRRVHEDPSLADRIMEIPAHEIRRLSQELTHLKAERAGPAGADGG